MILKLPQALSYPLRSIEIYWDLAPKIHQNPTSWGAESQAPSLAGASQMPCQEPGKFRHSSVQEAACAWGWPGWPGWLELRLLQLQRRSFLSFSQDIFGSNPHRESPHHSFLVNCLLGQPGDLNHPGISSFNLCNRNLWQGNFHLVADRLLWVLRGQSGRARRKSQKQLSPMGLSY